MLESEVSVLANLNGAHTHDERNVALGLVEFAFDEHRVALVLVDVLEMSERGAHWRADDHLWFAVFDEFADFGWDFVA